MYVCVCILYIYTHDAHAERFTVNIHVCVYMHIYVYVHNAHAGGFSVNICVCVYVWIYIYVYAHDAQLRSSR